MFSSIARAAAGLCLCGLLIAAPQFANAKIDLVTLPGTDSTELTIYKSEDITLVREVRSLTFSKGSNEIQFSWANTLIDPTSLQIRLVQNSPDFQLLDASYPANSQNTIIWNIDAVKDGNAQVEISYFASGLSWRADYSGIANPEETKLVLEPNFTITNNSGEDFENAKTRLVVGEINLVQAIATLAQMGIIRQQDEEQARRQISESMMRNEPVEADAMYFAQKAAAPAPAMEALTAAKEIVKAAVSEYYLYTIAGEESIETGWGKQLPNPAITDIPIDVSYEYNPNKYGYQVVKFYKFKNDQEHEMGDTPLPEGNWYLYNRDTKDGMRFQASYNHKYAPVGEDIELNLGSDGLVILEEKEMSQSRINFEFNKDGDVNGYDIRQEMTIEIRNSKDRDIPIKITRPMGWGDWEIENPSDEFKKVDRNTVEWEVSVPALAKKEVKFVSITRTGTRDRTNK